MTPEVAGLSPELIGRTITSVSYGTSDGADGVELRMIHLHLDNGSTLAISSEDHPMYVSVGNGFKTKHPIKTPAG